MNAPFFEPNKTWNCGLLGADAAYFSPFIDGDFMPMQLIVTATGIPYDDSSFATSTNGSPPIKVQAIDSSGFIFADIDEFCHSWSFGSSGGVQYLTFTIDASKVIDCFSVKVSIGTIEVARSHSFKRATCADSKTLAISSNYSGRGVCDEFYYSVPEFTTSQPIILPYQPFVRLYADFEKTAVTPSVTRNDRNRIVARSITENYSLYCTELLPPYMIDLLKSVLFGKTLTITTLDGTIYADLLFEGDIRKNNTASRNWLPNIELLTVCEQRSITCG